MFDNLPSALPQARAGKIKALGMASEKRIGVAPEVPTLTEGGVAVVGGTWVGMLAPAGTPRTIVDLLNRETVAAMKAPDIVERLAFEGVIAVGNSPEEFAAYIRKEHARIGKVIRASDAKFD